MNNSSFLKNLSILLTELLVVCLMVFNILPREAALFLTGLMIFYFIFSPLEDSLWIFIASIPLFVALPIVESFDSMANWRILSAVLFLVLFFRHGISVSLVKNTHGHWRLKEKFKHYRLEYLMGIFLLIGCLSFLSTDNVWAGIKKLLFLINIFLLYIVIRNLAAKKKEVVFKLIGAVKIAIGLTLGIGFIQLLSVFFVPLYNFWQFWAKQVIPVFYGRALGHLLSYSNAWFSYSSYPPTLRMFSVFPDSHSFAFFCILALPFLLVLIFLRKEKEAKKTFIYYLFLILCLMGVIFSGSRGAWVGALGSLFIFLIIILLYYSPTMRSWTDFFIPKFIKNWQKGLQLILGCLIIFFLLFPISSGALFLSQKAQLREHMLIEEISLFERVKSITDFFEVSAKSRLEIWQKTVDSIINRPFLGVGLGNYPVILQEEISAAKKGASAHNLYLEVASEIGIFGLLVLLAVFWQIFKDAWLFFSQRKKSFFQCWSGFFVLALIWILSYSLFDVVLLNDKVFLFFVTILALFYAAKSFSFSKSSDL